MSGATPACPPAGAALGAENSAQNSGGTLHADAALLALCARLRNMQAGWQRLWEATSDVSEGDGSAADLTFDRYSAWVWPGSNFTDIDDLTPDVDPVRGLLDLPATTPDGLRAKAAAVLALHDAAGYAGCERSDLGQIVAALLHDVAGTAAMPLDEAFTPIASEPGSTPAA